MMLAAKLALGVTAMASILSGAAMRGGMDEPDFDPPALSKSDRLAISPTYALVRTETVFPVASPQSENLEALRHRDRCAAKSRRYYRRGANAACR